MRDQKAINKKISDSLKGRRVHQAGFKKGYDSRRKLFGKDDWCLAVEKKKIIREKRYNTLSWNEYNIPEKRRKVLEEQGGKCLCGLSEWLGGRLVLELDHKDGNKKNSSRDNLRFLCPNCHSQTPTWRRKKSSV